MSLDCQAGQADQPVLQQMPHVSPALPLTSSCLASPAAGSALKPMRQSLDKIPQGDRNVVTSASRRPASNTRPLPPISAGSHPGTPSQGRTTLNENDNIKVTTAVSSMPINMLTAPCNGGMASA